MTERPIVFLHLPKTAGQSIRMLLRRSFPKRLMFPGQVDGHLPTYSRSDLRSYSLFAGHFSWALLDCLGDDALFFTVLREPASRIISFYTFLRRQAEAMSPSQLQLPQNQGIAAALRPLEDYLSPKDDPHLASFILSQFDNYYLYYFATRMCSGRGLVRDLHPPSDYFVTEQVLSSALRNLQSVQICDFCSLDKVTAILEKEEGYVPCHLPNVNRDPSGRSLTDVSHNIDAAMEIIYRYSEFDVSIYSMLR